jgi:hypothetical protein
MLANGSSYLTMDLRRRDLATLLLRGTTVNEIFDLNHSGNWVDKNTSGKDDRSVIRTGPYLTRSNVVTLE